MKGAKCLVLAPAIFIHQFHKYSVIVVVAQSPIKKYFHVKQNQYQSNKEQRSSVQHVSTFLCVNIEMRRLSCQVTGTIFPGRKGVGELCGMLELQGFGQKWLKKKKKKACHCLLCPLPPAIESMLCTQIGEHMNAPALSVFGVAFKKNLDAASQSYMQ